MMSGVPPALMLLHHGNPPHETAASGTLAVSAPMTSVAMASPTATLAARNVLGVAPARSAVLPRPPARLSITASVASSDIAMVRCAAMMKGFSAILTVTAPSRAAVTTRKAAIAAGRRTPIGPPTPGSLRLVNAMMSSATMMIESASAMYRCEISMIRSTRSCGGNHAPLHFGQWSPQPIPDPVMRTIAPKTIWANARTSAASERRFSDCTTASVNCAPGGPEKERQTDGGDDGPHHLGTPRRIRDGSRIARVAARDESGTKNCNFGDDAKRGGDPEDRFRERLEKSVSVMQGLSLPHRVSSSRVKLLARLIALQ